jgi:glycine cleavage system H lipoate-binding protein
MLVIAFLVAFAIVWQLTLQPRPARRKTPSRSPVRALGEWFRVADDVHYHPGHTWAQAVGGDVVRVGMDDFAQRLLGKPESIQLPSPGTRLTQGRKGWQLAVRSQPVDMLSPVSGEIVAVNPNLAQAPGLVNEDPYGEGWLFEVRVPDAKVLKRNLISGRFAKAWMSETMSALRERMGGELGPVLQDGGTLVSGFALELSPDRWHELAAEFLHTD